MQPRTAVYLCLVALAGTLPATIANEYRMATEDPASNAVFGHQVPRSSAVIDDAELNDIAVVGRRCWAVGERGVVVRSEDSGRTWSAAILPFDCSLNSVCFLTNRVGYVAGLTIDRYSRTDQGVLLTTKDGGETWSDVSPDVRLPGIATVRFFGPDQGIVITTRADGRGGRLLSTHDGGRSWQDISDSQDSHSDWTNAAFLRPDEGIVVGSQLTFGLATTGRLRSLSSPNKTLQAINGVSLSDNGTAWMVGDGCFVRMSLDRGVSWKPPAGSLDSVQDIFRLKCVVHQGRNVCIAGTPASVVLQSSDAGESWATVPCAANGSINRLVHAEAQTLLAVGAWGRIMRSEDFGRSWSTVRNESYRAALMYLVTDMHDASPLLLGTVAGEQGYRVSVLQASQRLNRPTRKSRWQSALSTLGVNSVTTDWQFVRIRKQHAMSQSALLESWNSSSDGRMRELLPLRLAAQIRTWQPDVICIESATSSDAVAAIWQAAIEPAKSIAAGHDPRSQTLDAAGLRPWSVTRVVRRAHSEPTPLEFRDDTVLSGLRTTAGVIANSWRVSLGTEPIPSRQFYAMPANDLSTPPRNLFQGLRLPPGSDARRRAWPIGAAHEDFQQLAKQHQAIRETITVEVGRNPRSHALIAHTRSVGSDMPEAMARDQLGHMLQLFRDTDNLESHIAVLRELVRRFPTSPEAAQAAEELHVLYSSAEVLLVRKQWQQQKSKRLKNSALSIVDGETPAGAEVRPASASSLDRLRPTLGSAAAALERQWSQQADIAQQTLMQLCPVKAASARHQLIQAARSRRLQQFGKERTLLTTAAAAADSTRLLAQNEMQATFSAVEPVLPSFNLPESRERPVLDGLLSDLCWQQTPEIRLADSVAGSRVPDSLLMFSWDDEFLYVAGRLPRAGRLGPEDEALDRNHDQADITSDHVELIVDVDRDYSSAWHFIIDSAGRTTDRCWNLASWNPNWFVATQRDSSGWRFEAAIPVQELQPNLLKAGEKWSVGIRRVVPGYADQQVSVDEVAQELETRYSLIRFIVNRRAD